MSAEDWLDDLLDSERRRILKQIGADWDADPEEREEPLACFHGRYGRCRECD